MNEKYKDFLEKNPTIESRIEAFTSGILSPDAKAITLWAMEPGRYYSNSELYTRVKEFSGGDFPITSEAIWAYCNGSPPHEGSLYRIGAVLKDEIEIMQTSEGPLIRVVYAKSDVGEDFGDCLAARALLLSQQLNSRYKSIWRIFGFANKPKDARTRKGYAVYKIIKELGTHPKKIYTASDLEAITQLPMEVLSKSLHSLGEAEIIDYESPFKEIKGKRVKEWANYILVNKELAKKNNEEIYEEIKLLKRFENPGYLEKILNYIKCNQEEEYENNKLSQKLKIIKCQVSNILSLLEVLGYLQSEFKGGNIQSKAIANSNTSLVLEILLKPIEAIAQRLDSDDYKGFYEPLVRYEDEAIRMRDIQNQLQIYENERSCRGRSSEEIVSILLSLPKREMKLSEIKEIIEGGLRRRVCSGNTINYLTNLIKSGKFEKTGRGRYLRK